MFLAETLAEGCPLELFGGDEVWTEGFDCLGQGRAALIEGEPDGFGQGRRVELELAR